MHLCESEGLIDMTEIKRFNTVKFLKHIVLALLTYAIIFGAILAPRTAYAISMNQLSDEQHKVVVEMYSTLSGLGYSDAAALAIIANAAYESGFNPAAENHLGCKGLLQFCFGRAESMVRAVPDWKTNVKAFIEYVDKELPNTQLITANAKTSRNMAGFPAELVVNYETVEQFKTEENYLPALAGWLTLWEIPCIGMTQCQGQWDLRSGFAKELLDGWEGVFGSKYGINSGASKKATDSCKMPEAGEKKSTGGSNGCDVGALKLQLQGMPEIVNLAEGISGVTLVQKADVSAEDLYTVGILKESREMDAESRKTNILGVGLGVLGILMMMWAVLIVVAYVFDTGNSVVPINATRMVTMGKIDVEAEKERGSNPGLKVAKMAGFIFLIGILVVGGGLFGMLDWVIHTFRGLM